MCFARFVPCGRCLYSRQGEGGSKYHTRLFHHPQLCRGGQPLALRRLDLEGAYGLSRPKDRAE